MIKSTKWKLATMAHNGKSIVRWAWAGEQVMAVDQPSFLFRELYIPLGGVPEVLFAPLPNLDLLILKKYMHEPPLLLVLACKVLHPGPFF
jgi:hypothetical protein